MNAKKYNEIATIQATATRCKDEGIPLGETALRRLVNEKSLPAAYIGTKALVNWNHVLAYLGITSVTTRSE